MTCSNRSCLKPRKASAGGFTLLELVLAVAIFSLVTAGAFAAINSLVQARDAQLSTAELLRQLQLTNHNLERDISQLLNRGARVDGLRQPAVLGQSGLLRGTKTGWGNPLGQRRSVLQRFQYRLLDQQLLREHWLHVDHSAQPPAVSSVLLDNVNLLQLRYQDSGREWRDEWLVSSNSNNAANSDLPRAIEVTIELADGRRIRRVFLTLAAEQ